VARIHGWAVAAGLLACTTTAFAQEVREYVENGVRYRETRSKVMRPVTETRFEERERTVYREQYSTETEEYTRLVNVPVTDTAGKPTGQAGSIRSRSLTWPTVTCR